MLRLALPVLLLFGAIGYPVAGSADECSVPSTYTHRTTLTWENFLVTLATDRPAYDIGDSVHFWLSFENIGTTPDTIPNPSSISPMDVIMVLPEPCDSVQQDGCNWLYLYSPIILPFGLPVILDAGECASYEHRWNGVDYYGRAIEPGTYRVLGGMASSNLHFHAPPGGIKLSIQLGLPVSTKRITWGLMKSKYE